MVTGTPFRRTDSVRYVSPHLKQEQIRTGRARLLGKHGPQHQGLVTGGSGRPRPKLKRNASKAASIASVASKAGNLSEGSVLPASQMKNMRGAGQRLTETYQRVAVIGQATSPHQDSDERAGGLSGAFVRSGAARSARPAQQALKRSVGASQNATRHAGRQAATAMQRAAVRTAHVLAAVVRKIVAAASLKIGAISLVVVAVLGIVAVIVSILPSFIFGLDVETRKVSAAVPGEYATYVLEAGQLCEGLSPSIIAAQIDAESGWNPRATSPAGAQGIAQFMPGTWASAGKDGNGDGIRDPYNAADSIISQGHYMCHMLDLVESRFGERDIVLALAAYNAGFGNVMNFNGVPPFSETRAYVEKIPHLAATTYATFGLAGQVGGPMVDDYPWAGVVRSADGSVTSLYNTVNWSTRFYYGNCTDFVFWRVNRDMGVEFNGADTAWVFTHPTLTPLGGNGREWGKPGNMPGWQTVTDPAQAQPGDVVSFESGAFGHTSPFGHVAYVSAVDLDGSITTENYGLGQYYIETIPASTARSLIASGQIVIKHNPALSGAGED